MLPVNVLILLVANLCNHTIAPVRQVAKNSDNRRAIVVGDLCANPVHHSCARCPIAEYSILRNFPLRMVLCLATGHVVVVVSCCIAHSSPKGFCKAFASFNIVGFWKIPSSDAARYLSWGIIWPLLRFLQHLVGWPFNCACVYQWSSFAKPIEHNLCS